MGNEKSTQGGASGGPGGYPPNRTSGPVLRKNDAGSLTTQFAQRYPESIADNFQSLDQVILSHIHRPLKICNKKSWHENTWYWTLVSTSLLRYVGLGKAMSCDNLLTMHARLTSPFATHIFCIVMYKVKGTISHTNHSSHLCSVRKHLKFQYPYTTMAWCSRSCKLDGSSDGCISSCIHLLFRSGRLEGMSLYWTNNIYLISLISSSLQKNQLNKCKINMLLSMTGFYKYLSKYVPHTSCCFRQITNSHFFLLIHVHVYVRVFIAHAIISFLPLCQLPCRLYLLLDLSLLAQ